MPIDTDVETRMKCYGKMDNIYEIGYCLENCCFIEHDLCYMETMKELETFKRELSKRVII